MPFGESADVVLINTCTVTDAADSTCRNLIRRAHQSSPEGKVVVVGCYAQMEPEKIASMQGVDLILGTSEKYKVFDYLDDEDKQVTAVDISDEFWGASTGLEDGHTRAFLKIQDGCNYICSFCIIPQARGRSRAISIEGALKEAQAILDRGIQEIVLTGVNIGEYEKSSQERLHHLVEKLLVLPKLKRLRLSSVEPNTISDDLLKVLKSSPKSMPHFHIPLQSGDDEILKAMRRRYSVSEYKEIIGKIKEYFPTAGIGADMIVGFPGESAAHFENTYNLVKELPLTHFHVFPYSKRKNTMAAKMDNHIPHAVKKDRARSLIMLGEAKLSLFAQEQVGLTREVLFEQKNKQGLWEGHTPEFVKVMVESSADLKNQLLPVMLVGVQGEKLLGKLSQ